MFQEEMLDYFKLRLKKVNRYYTNALEKNDPENVHDLRVELKYLKAFFKLVESINHDFNAKINFRDFRKIARKTSGLRDVQVQQKLVEKMNGSLKLDLNDYKVFLKKLENDNLGKFRNFSKENQINKLKKNNKIIKNALKDISPVRAVTRAQGRFYNLRNNLVLLSKENDLRDEILHEVRILSKETHYTLEVINRCFHIFKDSKDFIKKIIKVHKLLGEWHDYDVGLVYLNDFKEANSIDLAAEPHNHLAKHFYEKKDILGKNLRMVFNEFAQTASVYEHQK